MSDAVPDVVRAVAGRLGGMESEPEALWGGITNRNFRVRAGGGEYVIRVAGQDTELLGIDRRAENDAATAAASAGIAPEVALFAPDEGCLVTRFVDAHTLEGRELSAPGLLEQAARALRTFHAGPALPASFDAVAIGAVYRELALGRGVALPDVEAPASDRAAEIGAALRGAGDGPVPCHNDLLTANFLLDGDGRLWIVDWEYAGMGDRWFDLGNLAVNNELDEDGEERLLGAYLESPVSDRHRSCLRLARILSDYREAMWGVAQQGLSDLDFDFVGYADEHFQRLLAAVADPRYRDSLEETHAS
ncbi:MAG: phosphotransferase [Solirubrobacteraceae bacterium]